MSKLKLTMPAIVIALAVSWPAVRRGLFEGTLSMQSMLMRIGLAVFFGMVAVAIISSVVDAYRLENAVRRRREEAALRRADEDLAKHS